VRLAPVESKGQRGGVDRPHVMDQRRPPVWSESIGALNGVRGGPLLGGAMRPVAGDHARSCDWLSRARVRAAQGEHLTAEYPQFVISLPGSPNCGERCAKKHRFWTQCLSHGGIGTTVLLGLMLLASGPGKETLGLESRRRADGRNATGPPLADGSRLTLDESKSRLSAILNRNSTRSSRIRGQTAVRICPRF